MVELIEYGIAQEQTDIRAHVCVTAWRVYVYATREMMDLLQAREFVERPAHTNGKVTAKGYLVPPREIPGCRATVIPERYRALFRFSPDMKTSVKGRTAAQLVHTLMHDGLLPLPMSPRLVDNVRLQLRGVDIIARCNAFVQVKCDYDGGSKAYGGSGNLFIQTAELNPFKQH